MYLLYVLVAITVATYFWSWGSERRLGWPIAATAVAAAYVGAGLPFDARSAIGAAYCAAMTCLAIGHLGRTFYDQTHNPQPELSL